MPQHEGSMGLPAIYTELREYDRGKIRHTAGKSLMVINALRHSRDALAIRADTLEHRLIDSGADFSDIFAPARPLPQGRRKVTTHVGTN